MSRPTLGGDRQPDSFMDHLIEVLHFGEHVVTGRRDRPRDWILGNRRILSDESGLAGQIGWQRDDHRQASRYIAETQEWRDEDEPAELSAHSPFVIDGSSRILGVLKHPTFSEATVSRVFERLLRDGENERDWPSTEWSVEAILDERNFLDWLRSVESVTSIKLVAQLPNADGLEEFGPVWAEMQSRAARLSSTRLVAANEDVGLVGLEEDERVRGNLVMGTQGFGHVEATGQRQGHKTFYDQREKVAREWITDIGPTWQAAEDNMLGRIRQIAANIIRRGTAGLNDRHEQA